jgi:hypothetical protein
MPLTAAQRQRILENIASGRLSLGPPAKMYAGYGDGRSCDACGEVIDRTQVEYDATYADGRAHRVHLACAVLWDAERRRRGAGDSASPSETRARSQALREEARSTAKESAQLRDRADVMAAETEAVIEESLRLRRGQPPEKTD